MICAGIPSSFGLFLRPLVCGWRTVMFHFLARTVQYRVPSVTSSMKETYLGA